MSVSLHTLYILIYKGKKGDHYLGVLITGLRALARLQDGYPQTLIANAWGCLIAAASKCRTPGIDNKLWHTFLLSSFFNVKLYKV